MIKLKNHYHLELVDTLTGEVRQVVDCHNTILPSAINTLKNSGGFTLDTIAFGTGTSLTYPSMEKYLWGISDNRNSLTGAANVLTVTYPTAKRVLQLTVGADYAIGDLTECCLGTYGSWNTTQNTIRTRARFVDSEGNPIVIHKTATDILHVTVTVYYTFTPLQHPEEGTNVFLCNDSSALLFKVLIGAGGGGAVKFSPYKAHKYDINNIAGTEVGSGTWALVDGVYTISNITSTYSADYGPNGANGLFGYDLKSLAIAQVGNFNVTEAVFPPRPFPKHQLGVGDGTNKDFHIKTPTCKEGTQKVYIDGVLKTEGVDYTFNPINMKDCFTNWASADITYATCSILSGGSSSSQRGGPFCPITIGAAWNYNYVALPITYDFLVPIKVNSIMLDAVRSNYYADALNKVILEYSTDGTTWIKFSDITVAMQGKVSMFPEVTARYWRYRSEVGRSVTTYYTDGITDQTPPMLFGYYVPSVSFTTAPTAGAVVEAAYDLKYPFKNNRHSISMSYSVEFGCS